MTTVHEALVILYTRGITRDKIWIVTVITGVLALLGYIGTKYVVRYEDLQWPMTIGHMLGVPLGFAIPLERRGGSRKGGPTKTIGFQNSDPS